MAPPVAGIQAEGFAAFQRDVKKANADALKLFRAALTKAGQIVADDAKNRISGVSSRIAGTIRAGTTNKGVYVRAGGAKAPHAAAFENLGKSGEFRHPVFGNRNVWVSQPAHPFLLPALQGKEQQILDAIGEFLDQLTGEAGFS